MIDINRLGHQLPELRMAIAANWKELVDTTVLVDLPHEDLGPGDGLIQTIKKCNENIGAANSILVKGADVMTLGYSVRSVREHMNAVFTELSTP